jgi:hypothetical protein
MSSCSPPAEMTPTVCARRDGDTSGTAAAAAAARDAALSYVPPESIEPSDDAYPSSDPASASPPPLPIDAPCTQGLRHGDQLNARNWRLTTTAALSQWVARQRDGAAASAQQQPHQATRCEPCNTGRGRLNKTKTTKDEMKRRHDPPPPPPPPPRTKHP